jgi:hypothetical protein
MALFDEAHHKVSWLEKSFIYSLFGTNREAVNLESASLEEGTLLLPIGAGPELLSGARGPEVQDSRPLRP